jgi:hypothetical protein
MLAMSHYLKILWSVIMLDAIEVMGIFVGQ